MPAEGIHLTALREATAATQLAADVRARLVRHDDAARFGAILVDLPYFHRFAGEVLRYVTGRPARPSRWGAVLHEGGAVALLGALIDLARREQDPTFAAMALGLASHCAIDRALHPLINALARRDPAGPNHDASHREVEKFQSICFHEVYMGRDLMGTQSITHYLMIPLASRLDARQRMLLRDAWRAGLGDAPSDGELLGFCRGYRAHTRLLGTPLGKLIAPEPAKAAARPRYLHGCWGNFESLLQAAITASLPVLEAVHAVIDATTADVHAARALLASRLGRGSIDGQGDDVDLERPFQVALR